MGHIFEELIRKFAEASNETAGEHFTPREVIELMVSLLVDGDESLATPGIVREVYDPTAGTGGMLSVAADRIHGHNVGAGQPAGAGDQPRVVRHLQGRHGRQGPADRQHRARQHADRSGVRGPTFHYGLSNPPFGVDWKQYRKRIETEHAVAGFAGRFGGLPRVSDGSLLFLMHLVSKLREAKPGRTPSRGAVRSC
jgi:type I restriction enzyme M protein